VGEIEGKKGKERKGSQKRWERRKRLTLLTTKDHKGA
jgi:hypothetical protein